MGEVINVKFGIERDWSAIEAMVRSDLERNGRDIDPQLAVDLSALIMSALRKLGDNTFDTHFSPTIENLNFTADQLRAIHKVIDESVHTVSMRRADQELDRSIAVFKQFVVEIMQRLNLLQQ